MSAEKEKSKETRDIAQGFIDRLSRIADIKGYDYLKPIFDRKTYEADELELLGGVISGGLWNYNMYRLSQEYIDIGVTREPTSRNKDGSKESIRLRVLEKPLIMPFETEAIEGFITDLERIV